MTHTQLVKKAIAAGKKTIKEIMAYIGDAAPEPSVRRILGQGAIKGEFKRVERGVYELVTETGERRAYIRMDLAQEALPRMASEGKQYDSVFLDIAYFSKALIGGNRGIKKYDFLHPEEFTLALKAVYQMMRTDDSHVYLMLSGATTAQMDMNKYIFGVYETGFQVCREGSYRKLFNDGSPVTNVRGSIAAAERLLLLTRNGLYREGELPLEMDFKCIRPAIRSSYPTQKAEDFIDQIILQSTHPGDHILDPCAGSGIVGERSLLYNRIVTLVECLQETIENFICPRIQQFAL